MRSRHDEITQVIRHHWDRRANRFDDEIGHSLVTDEQRNAWFDLLSRLAGRAPRRVLDVGCGTGFLALRFAELGYTVTGIDLPPQMIDRARLMPNKHASKATTASAKPPPSTSLMKHTT